MPGNSGNRGNGGNTGNSTVIFVIVVLEVIVVTVEIEVISAWEVENARSFSLGVDRAASPM